MASPSIRTSDTPGARASLSDGGNKRLSITDGAAPKRLTLTKRVSSLVVDLKVEAKDVAAAVRPPHSAVPRDVLGMPAPSETADAALCVGGVAPPPPAPLDDDEHLEVTSEVLAESECDWAAETLLLTHEPLRRDMAAMNECLEERFFGALPESWRVRAFFRFFSGWSALLSQHHAVEAAVHCDWLAAPTGGLPDHYRQDLGTYHRKIEMQVVQVGRMEGKVLQELGQAADWTHTEPRSDTADELRGMLEDLCEAILAHLQEQETLLPALLRKHWGSIAPPDLVTRSIEAAKRATVKGQRPQIYVKLLQWVVYYLRERDEERTKFLIAQLSFVRRMRIALRVEKGHSDLLEQLRAIIRDEEPSYKPSRAPVEASPLPRLDLNNGDMGSPKSSFEDEGRLSARGREKRRRETGVNAVLAAANATRQNMVNDQDTENTTRKLAEKMTPTYQFGTPGAQMWWHQHKYQSGIWKNMKMDKPSTPRRL